MLNDVRTCSVFYMSDDKISTLSDYPVSLILLSTWSIFLAGWVKGVILSNFIIRTLIKNLCISGAGSPQCQLGAGPHPHHRSLHRGRGLPGHHYHLLPLLQVSATAAVPGKAYFLMGLNTNFFLQGLSYSIFIFLSLSLSSWACLFWLPLLGRQSLSYFALLTYFHPRYKRRIRRSNIKIVEAPVRALIPASLPPGSVMGPAPSLLGQVRLSLVNNTGLSLVNNIYFLFSGHEPQYTWEQWTDLWVARDCFTHRHSLIQKPSKIK